MHDLAAKLPIFICFYASNDGISILENAAKLGMPITKKLRGIPEQLNREEKNNAAK
ncbi:hypothetical protein FACS1894188_02160 [Clostridia bacterium]|nr:hypothetical protein FACS1894188_02160 [Clostridia bacterium]